MKILIVDDSDTSRMLLETMLRNAGYDDLIMACCAREALTILGIEGDDETSEPDLILMDIVMPDLSGIETTMLIKSEERFKDIPVIMVTVKESENSLEEAFEAGAIDFINKPVTKTELGARVRSVLKLKKETDRRKARERELEELTRKLEKLSNLDGLTGVANRRSFDDFFEEEWLRGLRSQTPISLLMIDIDHFKLFNDTYGHMQGDVCLKRVAGAINKAIKRPGDFVARYGGEEFVAILPDTSLEGACHIADLIMDYVEELKIEHEKSTTNDFITVSIGVSSITPHRSISRDTLINTADSALYRAKEAGRGRILCENVASDTNNTPS
ncbi:diguanylate cyclase [Limisalsivibrio acetivorans]|uniref:diguanylate cyclase n=1 Tax=Limisalsivibrio acetivorans TaxID=1304888 RepID=UPI0003B46E17|nr:diguanylate cyclase [Limisalsivibrio acetivorans]